MNKNQIHPNWVNEFLCIVLWEFVNFLRNFHKKHDESEHCAINWEHKYFSFIYKQKRCVFEIKKNAKTKLTMKSLDNCKRWTRKKKPKKIWIIISIQLAECDYIRNRIAVNSKIT